MYVYATEMVARYYRAVGLQDKTVLTVIGSGDQVINAHFLGARRVVGFDLNTWAIHMMNLKSAAIATLEYEEFMKYFGVSIATGSLDYALYVRMRDRVDRRTRRFFDNAYKRCGNKGGALAKSAYFRQRQYFKTTTREVNAYLKSGSAYAKTRGILKGERLELLNNDIRGVLELKAHKRKFDVVNLSNIPTYLFREFRSDDRVGEYILELGRLRGLLSRNGAMLHYSYSPSAYPNEVIEAMPPAAKKSTIDRIRRLKKFRVQERRFKGMKKGTFDKVIIFGNR